MFYKTSRELLSEIKHIMDLNDISIKELAVKLETSQQNISKILNGENARYSSIIKICDALNLDLDITLTKRK